MAGHPDFGRGVDHADILKLVLSSTSIKDSIAIQQIMFDVYETRYGIYNHAENQKKPPNERSPLASVAFHKSEDFCAVSLLEETMNIYRDLPVYDIFKMPYDRWMQMTPDVFDMMIRVARTKLDKELKVANEADKKMKDVMRANKQAAADDLIQHAKQPKPLPARPPSRLPLVPKV